MTRQKTFKRRVRTRMDKTGESYTAARRMLIANGDAPEGDVPTFEPLQSDETVTEATGHGWDHWFSVLDEAGGADMSHAEIARWLQDAQQVGSWWSQTITVSYERARGRRAPGQHADGFALTSSKTIAVPVERLFEAFTDEALRERWLPGGGLTLRTATAPRTARYDWEDGSTRVNVGFDATGDSKSRVALAHERLPDADTADAMRAYWRERLQALKALLEA
jgi:uncharacterized protein YndB with AHSA1/START domain